MQLRYNYRIYPTPAQASSLARAFGCARVVYNDGLRTRVDARDADLPYITDGELSKQVITQAKKTPERAWLGEVSAVVLQQALADLNTAYRNLFHSVSGKRNGRKVASPRLRSRKDSRQTIRFTRNARFCVTAGGKLRLPKIGDVTNNEPLPETDGQVGIDLGLSHFAVLSDGRKVDNPRFLRRAERKLRTAQKNLSRKQKGSANRKKAMLKVAKAHAKVAGTRRDWAHKLSTTIIRDNQAVYVEDLAVSGLARTRLAKSVHDAGWSQFVGMLEYKASRYGRYFGKVDRWFPSTRTCSECGAVGEAKPLSVREWICQCGTSHDRDVNAANNIHAAGRAERRNACGADVRPPVSAATGGEAGTRRDRAA